MPPSTRRTATLCLALSLGLLRPLHPSALAQNAPGGHAQRFLAGRTLADGSSAALALNAARRQHLALAQVSSPAAARTGAALGPAAPRANALNPSWQPVGPAQVSSQLYGAVTGRVTSIAIDPTDSTANTVYLGTTGGGVWKSVNAAGPAASVTFTPLTDTLPVFNPNAGTSALPSLSIGAVSVSPPGATHIVLAGTGDPNDASDSYYGQGILRSTDAGLTWTLAQGSHDGVAGNHSFTGLSVAGFAWNSNIPTLVVAALSQSAEGVLVNAPNTLYSVAGLYYSTDAGITWQMATIQDGGQVVQSPAISAYPGNASTAVVWNPIRQLFLAAVSYHGYYQSPDGVTWTRLAGQPGAGLTAAACSSFFAAAGNPSCPLFRGVLAVQPTTGDTFALTVDANNLDQGLWQDLCTLSGGSCANPIAFGKRLPSIPLEVGSGSTAIAQADYNLSLAAVATGSGPSADTLLFAGAIDLYRCSLAAGCVLRNTTNAANGCAAPAMVSPAQHALAVLAAAGAGGAAPLLYLGNDGGLWRSLDGVNQQQTPCSPDDATHFQNLNPGLGSLAEIVSFAQHPTDPATLLAGLGANGAASTSAAPSTAPWPQISAGEGGAVAVDQTNPQNWYVSTAAGVSLRFCNNGNLCSAANFTGSPTIGYAQTAGDTSVIDPPLLLDPALPSSVLIGTCRIWRGPAQTGSSWPGSNAISAPLGGPPNSTCSASTNPLVRSLAAAGPASGAVAAQSAGSTVLYAGLAGSLDGGGNYGGHLFANYAAATAGQGTAWTDVAQSPVTNDAADAGVFNPGGFDISSIDADPHDATGKTVYATVMGFAGNGVNAPHLYRSLSGGASWTNISSNLPNAPANAVVVDPNDANTLYVGLDTGVYVTTQVATCASANCWSVYGTALPNAPVVALQAAAGLPTGDGRFGELRAGTYGRGIWQVPLLTAASATAPAIALAPPSLTFAAQAVATASAAQTITVTNSGNASLVITQVSTTGDFTQTNTCVSAATIAPGAACAVQVAFLPTATGGRSGVLTLYANVPGGQATAALSGTGTPPAAIVLNPIALTFPSTNVGAQSLAQNIALSNTGGVSATLQTPVVSGDFKIAANTCGPSLGPGVGCTIALSFAPTASGARTGSFTLTDSAGTQTASLSGAGLLPATDALSPLILSFAPQQLNTASPAQPITLTNNGDAALTLIAAQIVSGDFTVVNSCGNSLIPHSTCALLVTFAPKSVGPGSGVLTLSDQYRSQNVTLNGSGVAPAGVSLSPLSTLTFAATGVALGAAPQTVTLTNNGGLPLLIQSIASTGDFTLPAATNTCGATLPPATACTLQVLFTPTAAGPRTGILTVADNASSSPQTLQLTGTGIDFTLNANGSTSATLSAGAQAVYPLLLSSIAGLPGSVSFTCAPLPAHATCAVNPAAPALGATTAISVTLSTSVAGAELHLPGQQPLAWLAGLLPLGLLALRRRTLRRLGTVALLSLSLLGCGTSRLIPSTENSSSGGPAAPTPAGAYNLIVSGSGAGLTRSVALTLIVQ